MSSFTSSSSKLKGEISASISSSSSSQIIREEKCLICYEQFHTFDQHTHHPPQQHYEGAIASLTYSAQGIFCNNCHFICNSDLRQFCSENIFPKIFHLRESKGKILCPLPSCHASYDTMTVISKLDPLERKRYTNLIHEIVFPEDPRMKKIANVIRDLLTLCCPHCKTAIDPSPDACSAILCLNCSSYYCNYCFQCFTSKDAAKDKADCHIHVGSHNPSTAPSASGDPFLPRELVLLGQKNYTESRIFQCLQLALSSTDYAEDAMHIVAMGYAVCYEDIVGLSIDPLKNWFAAISSATATKNPFLSSKLKSNENLTSETKAGEEHQAGNHSGKILANAIISHNDVAIRQILSAYQTDLDVNYCETVVVSDGEQTRVSYPITTLAILMGYNWVAIELIKLGANLYAKDNTHGRTVLMIVLEKACSDILEFLFVHPFDEPIDWNAPLTEEENQYNALLIAARFGHGHLFTKLLQHGANIETIERTYGYPALATSILHDHQIAAIALLRQGADIYHPSRSGVTPIYIALERGQLLVLREMVKYFPHALETSVKPHESEGFKAIHVAIQYQMNHLLHYLIDEAKVNINDVENIDQMSPFVMAVLYGNTIAAKILLDHNADIYCSYFDRERLPIFTIIERGYVDLLKIILSKHPTIVNQSCDRNQLTGYHPLSIAVLFNQYPSLEVLLQHGAEIDYQDESSGFTAIMCAAVNQQILNFQLLLSYSPNIHILSKQRRKLLYIIAELGLIDMFYLLMNHFPELNVNDVIGEDQRTTALHVACMHNQTEIISCLLEKGGNIEAKTIDGLTVLQICDVYQAIACKNVILSLVPPRRL